MPTKTKSSKVQTRRPALTKLRQDNEAARLKLDTVARTHRANVLQKYDAVETSTARRRPSPETKNEDEIYGPRKRALGANVGRDLERNYSPARGILHQFRINVVGHLGKIQVNTEGGKVAAEWFNEVWSKDCDFRESLHWSDICQNVVASILREGDVVTVFDDELIEDSGKLLYWESDQVVPLSDKLFRDSQWGNMPGFTQDGGIIRDNYGRAMAYVTTGKRGAMIVDKKEDATIWSRDVARHVKCNWRLNQGRGIPAILASANSFQDLYEILTAELATAKRRAVIAGYTKRAEAVTDYDNPGDTPEFLPENTGKATDTVDAEAANAATNEGTNYERFEQLAGGYWEYLQSGDEVEFPNIDRPNIHLPEFIESVLGHAGAGMGIARAYATLHAETSYTAFRGEMILSWATFTCMQKWLERSFADWVGIRALNWGMRQGFIDEMPGGWERSISWAWPKMPAVDELKEQKGRQAALQNITTNWSELLGPDWQTKITAMGEQLEIIRAAGISTNGIFGKSEIETTDDDGQPDDGQPDDGEGLQSGSGLNKWI